MEQSGGEGRSCPSAFLRVHGWLRRGGLALCPRPLASREGPSCASSAPRFGHDRTGSAVLTPGCSAKGSLLRAGAPCWWQAPAGGTHLLLLVWVSSCSEEHGAGPTPAAGKTRRRCLLFLTGASDPGLPRSAELPRIQPIEGFWAILKNHWVTRETHIGS